MHTTMSTRARALWGSCRPQLDDGREEDHTRRERVVFNHRANGALNDRLQPVFGSAWKVFILILICFSLVSFSLYRYYKFQGRGTPPTLKVNVDCSPCAGAVNHTIPAYCEMPNEFQFEKFIWLITDGYPLYMQKKWLDIYESHAVPFTVAVPGKKWSHAIYTSWFTGMPNLNLLANVITGDTIFQSMRRASGDHCSLNPPMDLNVSSANAGNFTETFNFTNNWIGPYWCPIGLLGWEQFVKTELNFATMEDVVEDLDLFNPYPSIPIANFTNILNEKKNLGQSLVAHSGLIDKASHYNIDIRPHEKHLHEFFSNLDIKKFIDENPDYLLILSSDHGISKDGGFHGDSKTLPSGNIGTFTFYNPRFTPQNFSEIDVVDVHPTLAKYLKNVDISYYSVGEVRNSFGPGNEKYMANALKQNLRQLTQLAEDEGIDVDTEMVENLIANSNNETELRAAVRVYKDALFNTNVRPFYVWTIVGLSAAGVVCFAYWVWFVNARALLRTFILYLPMMISLGFFIIVLTLPDAHHTQFNITFHIGLWLSAGFAMIFSGWRLSSYIVLNEIFNVIGFAYRYTNSVYFFPALLVALIGLGLSLAETVHHLSQKRAPWRSYVLPGTLHLFHLIYLCTKSASGVYVFGFHVFATAIYVSFPAAMIYVSYTAVRARFQKTAPAPDAEPAVFALSSFLLLLCGGTPLIPLINFQARQILPCLFAKGRASEEYSQVDLEPAQDEKHLLAQSAGDEKPAAARAARGCCERIGQAPGEDPASRPSHYSLQANTTYVLYQATWILFFVWGFLPDLDVNANGGVPGVLSWNDYPTVSGGMLGLRKFAVYPLLAAHVAAGVVPGLFPYFALTLLTLTNCFSVNLCFRLFTYTTQHESMMGYAILSAAQFLIIFLVKCMQPTIEDRPLWGFTFVNKVQSRVFPAVDSLIARWRIRKWSMLKDTEYENPLEEL